MTKKRTKQIENTNHLGKHNFLVTLLAFALSQFIYLFADSVNGLTTQILINNKF